MVILYSQESELSNGTKPWSSKILTKSTYQQSFNRSFRLSQSIISNLTLLCHPILFYFGIKILNVTRFLVFCEDTTHFIFFTFLLAPNFWIKILKEFSTKLPYLTAVIEAHTTKCFSYNINKCCAVLPIN
jgi:hypothetical protein